MTSHNRISIPFNKPSLVGKELAYIQHAIDGGHTSGDGQYTISCQHYLEREIGAKKALLTPSCTAALEMAALLLDLKPGDEVIVPSFTFVSSASSFALHGAHIIFCDVHSNTLNIDERMVEKLLTPRTKAIIAVHYSGVACNMDAIVQIAERQRLMVIEDNAHGLFGRYRGRFLGAIGNLGTLSFHETKNFSCGEGGALLINDPEYLERSEVIRDKGTNRKRFFCGQVDRYTWVDLGSSYVMSDILGAFLLAQLEAKTSVLMLRKTIWDFYYTNLSDWAAQWDVQLPFIPETSVPSYHMFYMILPKSTSQQALIQHLRKKGIMAVFHYQPLHQSPAGVRFGKAPIPCPVTETVSTRLVRLPFYNTLSIEDLNHITEAVREFHP